MHRWFKYTGLALVGVVFAFVYYGFFGPILAVAFASTALLAAIGVAKGLTRLGYGNEERAARRVIPLFFIFLILLVVFDPMDGCVDGGGVWDWYSASCAR